MAWIKGNKIIKILDSGSQNGLKQKIKQCEKQDYKLEGSIKSFGTGWGCMVVKELKVSK